MKRLNDARGTWGRALGLAAAAALLAGAPSLACAQDTKPPAPAAKAEALPSGAEIHAKYIKAIGGEEALKGIKSRISTATLTVPGNMTAKLDSYQADGAMYVLMDLQGIGKFESGITEGICWQRNPLQGPQIMNGPEKEQLIREADLQNEINVTKYYTKLETVGAEDVDGKKAYKVEFTPTTGEKQTRFYDAESGLLVKIESIQEMNGGKQPISATISDYRDVDGFKFPFKMTQAAMGTSSSIVYETIAVNKDIPAEKLKTPADIKALAEKKKADDAKPADPKPAEPKPAEPKNDDPKPAPKR